MDLFSTSTDVVAYVAVVRTAEELAALDVSSRQDFDRVLVVRPHGRFMVRWASEADAEGGGFYRPASLAPEQPGRWVFEGEAHSAARELVEAVNLYGTNNGEVWAPDTRLAERTLSASTSSSVPLVVQATLALYGVFEAPAVTGSEVQVSLSIDGQVTNQLSAHGSQAGHGVYCCFSDVVRLPPGQYAIALMGSAEAATRFRGWAQLLTQAFSF